MKFKKQRLYYLMQLKLQMMYLEERKCVLIELKTPERWRVNERLCDKNDPELL